MYPHEAEAYAAALGPGHGVGIVLRPEYGVFCVDIDGALVNGEWTALALAFLKRFEGCYVEVSMSGTGLHIFGSYTGAPPAHMSKNVQLHVECYTDLRYIALTGTNAVGDVTQDATATLHQFVADYFVKSPEDSAHDGWTDVPHTDWSGDSDDDTLLEKAMKSKSMAARFGSAATFADLYTANAVVLGRHMPPNATSKAPYDESSADLSLANHLAFWTGNDCERMLRLMQGSALNRDKWEQREGYLRDTIVKACARQKTFATNRTRKPAPLVQQAPPPPAQLTVTLLPVPTAMSAAEPCTAKGQFIGVDGMMVLFAGCTYVQDVHEVMTPDGIGLDQKRFEAQYNAGRTFAHTPMGEKPSKSAWEAFVESGVWDFPKVRGMYFDPRESAGAIKQRDGALWINSWKPVEIVATPGDPSLFLNHLRILLPDDWRQLLNYLKWIVQNKGAKCMWWPFIQGIQGNGKSLINSVVEYCIGNRYTQKPTPANMDSNFNASLYGCLFLALEDVKIADDYGHMWETIKPMITQDSLEIEFKGVDKVTREICFNGIMNSNHKAGIRRTPAERRIASFFTAQQHATHLARDGLTNEYFNGPEGLRTWLLGPGYAIVAHYLLTDPVDADFRTDYAPDTTSAAEHILVSYGTVEQDIIEHARLGTVGFAGGWINGNKVDIMPKTDRMIPRAQRQAMIESLGYQLHPGLPAGRVEGLLSDGTASPLLYVRNDHTTLTMTDPKQIRTTYEAAQRVK